LHWHNRGGSRMPVTYTFRSKFGLALIHCVRQVDSQAAAASQSTPSAIKRSRRRPTAKLSNFHSTSASFGNSISISCLLTFLHLCRFHVILWTWMLNCNKSVVNIEFYSRKFVKFLFTLNFFLIIFTWTCLFNTVRDSLIACRKQALFWRCDCMTVVEDWPKTAKSKDSYTLLKCINGNRRKNLTVCWSTPPATFASIPSKVNSAFHPSGVGKWVPASARKAKAGMV